MSADPIPYASHDGYVFTDPALGELARLGETGEMDGARVKAAAIDYAAGLIAEFEARNLCDDLDDWLDE